jgi:hypothetical protein
MKNIEKRIKELENISTGRVLPILRLFREEQQTNEEAFREAGHPGEMKDYFIICRFVVPIPDWIKEAAKNLGS